MIKQICDMLNKVCCRGEEMDRMMTDLTKFRESAAKVEDILKELKGTKKCTCTLEKKIMCGKSFGI